MYLDFTFYCFTAFHYSWFSLMSFGPNFTVFKSKFFWTFQVFVHGNRCSTSPIKQPQVTYIFTSILFSLVSTPLPIHLLHPPTFNTIMFSDCFLPYWFLWDSNLTGENCHEPSHTHGGLYSPPGIPPGIPLESPNSAGLIPEFDIPPDCRWNITGMVFYLLCLVSPYLVPLHSIEKF